MKNTIPRTPFSTPLSRSARETELRLRNIFSGPKKRPPALFLALVFAACLLCGNLVSCQMAGADSTEPPPTEVWVDYWVVPLTDGAKSEIELPEYPGVTFRWSSDRVTAAKDGKETELVRGMPIWNVFLCDLNGDGLRELCATVSYGSGMIDDHVVVCDYASGTNYTLWDRGEYDYVLSLEDGQLRVTKSEYLGPEVSVGSLVLNEDGELELTDEEPVIFFSEPLPTDSLPLDEPVELMFCSGAGAWQTRLILNPDGTFTGDYCDADMNIHYVCQFHGQFGDIVQLSGASYSLTLDELVLDTPYPIGEEWDEGEIHNISSEPYGFDDSNYKTLEPGAQFTFYTPDASANIPGTELFGMEDESSELYEFWTWWPERHQISGTDETLGCYALHNETSGRGFFDLHAWGIG